MKRLRTAAVLFAMLFAGPALAQGELRIGLGDDPGSLDPTMNASFVGRISLQSACDKLVDVDTKGQIVPMLAQSWEWSGDGKTLTLKLRDGVVYQDGEAFDAESVRYNLDRHLNMQGSRRRPEIAMIDKVQVEDRLTVKLSLKQPSVSLLAIFTDRAGMMVSRKAVEAATPAQFSNKPVCAGPYRITDYKPQQTITMEKFDKHWRAKDYSFDRVVFEAMPDSNLRLLNLRAGKLDLIEQIQPSALASVEKDPSLKIAVGEQPAYTMVVFNLTGPAAEPNFAKHAALREAFHLAIDRIALNQAVFGGRYFAGNQPHPPSSMWFSEKYPVKPRDLSAAKTKMAETGLASASLELLVSTNPEEQEVAQVIQAMVAEVGIKLNIKAMEFISMRNQSLKGDFQAYLVPSAGRVDPDLNISLMVACGMANNVGKYCNQDLDDKLAQARAIAEPEKRKPIYNEITDILMKDYPVVYVFNQRSAFGHKANLIGFRAFPDGIVRLEGLKRR